MVWDSFSRFNGGCPSSHGFKRSKPDLSLVFQDFLHSTMQGTGCNKLSHNCLLKGDNMVKRAKSCKLIHLHVQLINKKIN